MISAPPVIKDLVLIGGGHSHVAVLRAFGMAPLPGARITLVSRDFRTPYSGMLPGVIAGRYTVNEAHIDLVPLCRFARARFVEDEVTGVDPESRTVLFASRPPLPYDFLSINCGSTPSRKGIDDPENRLIPVKPIDRFLDQWHGLLARLDERETPAKIAVVGGGVGGVELMLAVSARLTDGASVSGTPTPGFELLTDGPDILTMHPERVRDRLRRHLEARGVTIVTDARVNVYADGYIGTADNRKFAADEVLCVTNAAAPAWIARSGLETDADGFLLVDDELRSVSHSDVFGAGDAVTMRDSPRPKSGVYAVRQGRPLTGNLRRAALREPLARYRPQREFLRLIGTGDGRAVAARGPWSAEGAWVWSWKDRIDRRFMRRFRELPEMDADERAPVVPRVLARELDDGGDGMRCGGCGAKVGADVLTAALEDLRAEQIAEHSARPDIVVGLASPDDAAIVSVPADRLAVLTVDAFRPMVEDPFLFGQITANHCLNDLYAMGADAQCALTLATLPVWPERKLADELKQMLTGAARVFDAAGAAIVGGHTSEGAELSLGFSVTGLIRRESWLAKSTPQRGDRLVLTKALGTGTLLAADMRGKASGTWIEGAIASMLQSNRAASRILRAHGASACTDITGFGLLGHLLEMTSRAQLGVTIYPDRLPVLEGARETASSGFLSTLQPKNERAAAGALGGVVLPTDPVYALLFDPQTAGGLLAAVPADLASSCVESLRNEGYAASTIIGTVDAALADDTAARVRFGTLGLAAAGDAESIAS